MLDIFKSKVITILGIYIGTWFYTMAAYLHLKLGDQWTFAKAYLMAAPLVLCEYLFSTNSNRAANYFHKFNPLQILIITMCFYFINLWILNKVVLKNQVVWWREIICFALIICAFFITTAWAR